MSNSALTHVGSAGVSLVDDNEVRGGAKKLVAATFGLDEVCRDDCVREDVEQALADRAGPLQTAGR